MITPQQAIVAYPELAGLLAITQQAPEWVFNRKIRDSHIDALSGIRVWPDGTIDQVGIKGESNAAALRSNPDDVIVWMTSGTVADVTARVLEELLPPGHSLAPRTPRAQVIAVVNGFGKGKTA